MTDINILGVLTGLAKKRPVFHNEADFQFALAWEIQKHNSEVGIRLEYKVPEFEARYTDIWIRGNNPVAIELKYKPISTTLQNNGEIFELKKHGAEDIGRYDFLKDVQRVEEITLKYPDVTGYAIILTNDHLYWNKPQKQDSVDSAFKIHEGKDIHGILSWSSQAGDGTTKNRTKPIIIKGHYNANWTQYSVISDQKYVEFKMLCFKIKLPN